MDDFTIYLAIRPDNGSTITVTRSGTTLEDGAIIDFNDLLTVSVSTDSSYELSHIYAGRNGPNTHGYTDTEINNESTIRVHDYGGDDGGTFFIWTVTKSSLVDITGTTDATIEVSPATISMSSGDSSKYCSIKYSFMGHSGYINGDGTLVQSVERFPVSGDKTISIYIPDDFYQYLPSSTSGECNLTCTTYKSRTGSTIGSTDTSFLIKTSQDVCSPKINNVNYYDINPATISLTGDDSYIVAYASTAKVIIQGESSMKGAKISKIEITNSESTHIDYIIPSADEIEYTYTTTHEISQRLVRCTITDTRGYTGTYNINFNIIPYVPLSVNISNASRAHNTSTDVRLSLDGRYFNGNFGAQRNSLTLQFRYRKTLDQTFSDWAIIGADAVSVGASYTLSNKLLPVVFKYTDTYELQVLATDRISTGVIASVMVQHGVPVFDWGKDDFNLYVPLRINGVDIHDIIYPVGSVFMSSSDTMPNWMSGGDYGTWDSVETGIDGIYGWKRTSGVET